MEWRKQKMKKLIKNSELIKRVLLVVMASMLTILSLVMLSISYESYNDGYGTDISIDMDYLVLTLCGIAFLIYGVYSIIAYKKNYSTQSAYYGTLGTISVLLSFYPLGVFFKALAKEKPFLEIQEYLYIGLLGLVFLLYLLFTYLSDKNKETKKGQN